MATYRKALCHHGEDDSSNNYQSANSKMNLIMINTYTMQ